MEQNRRNRISTRYFWLGFACLVGGVVMLVLLQTATLFPSEFVLLTALLLIVGVVLIISASNQLEGEGSPGKFR